jgi:hypothetical protein
MAALATAAISRVGTETSRAQAQVTVTMTVPAKAAPTNAPSSALQIPGAATPSDPVTPSSSDATQLQAALSVRTVTVKTQPAAIVTAPAAVSTAPAATMTVSQPATTAKTPTATKSTATRTPKPSASTSTRTPITGSNSAFWAKTWSHHQGGIHAACRGDSLAYAEPWAEKGYKVVKQTSWFRTAISFKGSTPVTVLVGCHAGRPNFTTSG